MHQTNQALLACLSIRRETQREGLCLASINRQLFSLCYESGIGFHLPYWKFILKQNVSAMSIDNHLHISRQFTASEMFPFYRNTKTVYL